MISWRCRISVASRIDAHCTSITTAQRKKQRLHLTKCVRVAHLRGAAMRPTRDATRRQDARCDVDDASRAAARHCKSPDRTRTFCTRGICVCASTARRADEIAHEFLCVRHHKWTCTQGKKFLHKLPVGAFAKPEIDQKRANQRRLIRAFTTTREPIFRSRASFIAGVFAVACSAARQRPSFFFSSSLTACGFALPPDDFIT